MDFDSSYSARRLLAAILLHAISESNCHAYCLPYKQRKSVAIENARRWLVDSEICGYYCELLSVNRAALADRLRKSWT